MNSRYYFLLLIFFCLVETSACANKTQDHLILETLPTPDNLTTPHKIITFYDYTALNIILEEYRSKSAVMDFYTHYLKNNGWEKINQDSFKKDDKILELNISPDKEKNEVYVIISIHTHKGFQKF